MPPQQTSGSQFDFMYKTQQAPKRRLLPSLNLPKPLKIILAVVAGLIVLFIITSIISSRKASANQPYINVLSRQQEILRVTVLAQPQLKDSSTASISATTTSAVSSEQAQLKNYLLKNHTKVGDKQLGGYLDSSTDKKLQTASQNNAADAAYISYLGKTLNLYKADLQTAYKVAGPNGKKLMSDAFDSTNTILAAPQFKS